MPALPPALDALSERWAAAAPRTRSLLVGVVIVLAAVLLSARATSSPWGEPATTVVAARGLGLAQVLTAGDVREVDRPVELLPEGAVTGAEDVIGRTTSRAIAPGAVITIGDVSPGGPAADLPPGQVAFPLPLHPTAAVEPGQHVDLVTGDGSGSGHLLAAAALVLAVEDETVWVAVRREEAPVLAGASRWGEVTPVLLPP